MARLLLLSLLTELRRAPSISFLLSDGLISATYRQYIHAAWDGTHDSVESTYASKPPTSFYTGDALLHNRYLSRARKGNTTGLIISGGHCPHDATEGNNEEVEIEESPQKDCWPFNWWHLKLCPVTKSFL